MGNNVLYRPKKNEKIALSLEGGGARGAYQIGAIKALFENGYSFDCVVGTSIGAINAAYIAQGDFEKVYKLWQTLSFKDLLNLEDDAMIKALNVDLDIPTVKYLSKKIGEALKNGGLDITNERDILTRDIDEKKLRSSKIIFGLVTLCISDINGEEKFIYEIPDGKVVDYIMASSNLPVFKRLVIDDKKYLDGGAWDNCPVHMLEEKGYKNVIVIRAHKKMRIRDYKNIIKRGNITIHMIEPIDTLPGILNFDTKNLNELIKLGYYDALKSIKGLDGFRYYINYLKEDEILKRIYKVDTKVIIDMLVDLKVNLVRGKTIYDIFIDKVLPQLVSVTKVKKASDVKESIYALIEHVALAENIDKYKIYDFDELLNLVKVKKIKKDMKMNDKNKMICDFISNI